MSKNNESLAFYLDQLGLSPSASQEEIVEKYNNLNEKARLLLLATHPDKQQNKESKETIDYLAAKVDWNRVKKAYKKIMEIMASSPQEIAEPDRKEFSEKKQPSAYPKKSFEPIEPVTEAGLKERIQIDKKRYPDKFPLDDNGIKNLWKLIQSKRLSYKEFQQLPDREASIICSVVLHDKTMTDLFFKGIKKDWHGEYYRVIDFLPVEQKLEVYEEHAFKTLAKFSSNFNEKDKYFIRIAEKIGGRIDDRCCLDAIFLNRHDNSNKKKEMLNTLGMYKLVCRKMLSTIHEYRNKVEEEGPLLNLEKLCTKLAYCRKIAFHDAFEVITPIYETWVLPIKALIEFFNRPALKGDPVSQVRVAQLKILLHETKKVIQDEVTTWFNEPNPEGLFLTSREADEKRAKKKENLFQRIIDLKETYEKKEYIAALGQHRETNLIVAIVRKVGYFLLSLFTAFQKDSFCYRMRGYTNTQVSLFGKTRAIQELKEKSEAVRLAAKHSIR